MGAIDSEGVWIYDNTDQMIPHATYSNLLANSVSDAFTALRAELLADLALPDTGWVNLTMASGWEPTPGYPCMVRRYGQSVGFKGRVKTISGATATGSHIPCAIPAALSAIWPDTIRDATGFAAGAPYRQFVAPDGNFQVQSMPATNTINLSSMNYIL